MKMKEVEKGKTEEVIGSFVLMILLYRARPVANDIWFVKVRIFDSIVAIPKRETLDEESLKPLKTKSMAEIGFGRMRKRVRRKRRAFIVEEEDEDEEEATREVCCHNFGDKEAMKTVVERKVGSLRQRFDFFF